MKEKRKGIYIHIPFCHEKCNYCDFLTFSHVESRYADYIRALEEEIRMPRPQIEADSLYFGGGTPSILKGEDLKRLASACEESFSLTDDCERTLECNPQDITPSFAKTLREAGFNRVSLGAQTHSKERLALLGRTHSPEQVERAVDALREVGFDNISLDFIFGLPGETLNEVEDNLHFIEKLNPDHISYYSLILEEKTLLYYQVQKGQVQLPDEDAVVDAWELILSYFKNSPWKRYEISNFARKGKESRHNLKYWRQEPYLGLGIGATGTLYFKEKGVRHVNPVKFSDYLEAKKTSDEYGFLEAGSTEVLGREDLFFEALLMGLRKVAGVPLAAMEEDYPEEWKKTQDLRKNWIQKGLAEEGKNFRLTEKGLDLQNPIMLELLETLDL